MGYLNLINLNLHYNVETTNRILFFVGIFGIVFITSLGIDIYNNNLEEKENGNGSKNIEDIERDIVAFGTFVTSLSLAIISAFIGTIFMIFVKNASPDNSYYGWIWNIIINGIAVVCGGLAWDVSTRLKSTGITDSIGIGYDRKLFMFLTLFYIVLWFISLKMAPIND